MQYLSLAKYLDSYTEKRMQPSCQSSEVESRSTGEKYEAFTILVFNEMFIRKYIYIFYLVGNAFLFVFYFLFNRKSLFCCKLLPNAFLLK